MTAEHRAFALELSLRTIAILHRESTAYRGFCAECNQEHPCVTNLEASAHLDRERPPQKPCPDCGHLGNEAFNCPTCGGHGWVLDNDGETHG